MYRGKGASRAYPILPIGRINLTTGKSKYFNIYETWGEESTYEIYEKISDYSSYNLQEEGKKKYYIVTTSGKRPIQEVGDVKIFVHDQTRQFLFKGKMIDFAVGSELKEKASKYKNSIAGATYK